MPNSASESASCGLRVVRIDLLPFLAGCRTRRLNQVLSVFNLRMFLLSCLLGPLLMYRYFSLVYVLLLVVLVKLSVLSKWLARKTPLRKPNGGEGIVSKKPRPKSVHDFLGLFGLLRCFTVQLYICLVPLPYEYSLFVLKVLLNNNKPNLPLVYFSCKWWFW